MLNIIGNRAFYLQSTVLKVIFLATLMNATNIAKILTLKTNTFSVIGNS